MRPLRSLAIAASCLACGSANENTGALDGGKDRTEPRDVAPDVAIEAANGDGGSGECTGPGLAKRWASMDKAVITATSAANLDLDQDGGLTLANAQAVLCQGTELASLPDGSHVQAWGASNEVELQFDPGSGDAEGLSLFQGYSGSFEFQSDPKAGPVHHYTLGIGQLEEDGAPIEIEWAANPFTVGTDVFNALMYTYGSPLGIYCGPLTTSCQKVSVCPVNTSSGDAIWDIVPLGITFTFGSVEEQPAASTAKEIDLSVP
jgi:hypothetical protein